MFGVSALTWLTTLSQVPLSVAYPFNAIGLLIVVGSSVVVLHEKVSPLGWLGVLAVVGGLILVVVSQTGQRAFERDETSEVWLPDFPALCNDLGIVKSDMRGKID